MSNLNPQEINPTGMTEEGLDYSDLLKAFEDYFNCIGTPMTYAQYCDTFVHYTAESHFFSLDRIQVIKDFYQESLFVHQLLSPLYQLGIKFELSLFGDCVRDFLMGKEVEKLTFLVNIESKIDSDNTYLDLLYKFDSIEIFNQALYDVGFSKKQITKFNHDSTEISINQMVKFLFSHCISEEKIENQKTYQEKFLNQSDYTQFIDNPVSSEFTLRSGKYPLQIIVTQRHVLDFIDNLDFNFSKVYFDLVNPDKRIVFPRDYQSLRQKFCADFSFFADILNQKITVEANLKNLNNFDSIIAKYCRLKTKYPQHSLASVINNQNVSGNESDSHNQYPEILYKKYLDMILDKKSENRPKIKI